MPIFRVDPGELPDLPLAECKELDEGDSPEDFFPKAADYRKAARTRERYCSICPERLPCLEYAVTTGALGNWGGTNEVARRDIKGARHSPRAIVMVDVDLKSTDGAKTARIRRDDKKHTAAA